MSFRKGKHKEPSKWQRFIQSIMEVEGENMEDTLFEKFEKAFDSWKAGDKSEELQRVLLDSGLEQYKTDGKYNVDAVREICEKSHKGETVYRKDKHILQDLYECLEWENFHTEIEAIELFTGIPYL